jgi:hypothetical protein
MLALEECPLFRVKPVVVLNDTELGFSILILALS